MNFNPANFNSNGQRVRFTSIKAPSNKDLQAVGNGIKGLISRDDIAMVRKISDGSLGKLRGELLDTIADKHPQMIKDIDGERYIAQDSSLIERVLTGISDFFKLPMDALDAIASRFPNSALNNSAFLQKHREKVALDGQIRALQGLEKETITLLRAGLPLDKKFPIDECSEEYEQICNSVAQNLVNGVNKAMDESVADYDTKKERFVTRLVSGLTAAAFLGTDYYNKAIQSGQTEENARKAQGKKQKQEVLENIYEALIQFGVFSCFSGLVNKSIWAPAIISTAIGTVSRIISRLSSGMRITRVNVADEGIINTPSISINDFKKSVKKGDAEVEKVIKKKKEEIQETSSKKKSTVLSAKNLALVCLASVVGGYTLKFLKGHTGIGQKITEILKERAKKFDSETIEPVLADRKTLEKIEAIFKEDGQEKLADRFHYCKDLIENERRLVNLGTKYKTKNIFGVEIRIRSLKELPTAPFRFLRDLVTFPYKIATKLENAMKNSTNKAKGIPPLGEKKDLEDLHDIKNIYLKFMEIDKKTNGDDEKLLKEFLGAVKKGYLQNYNQVSASKGDNSKIAILAQTLGTVAGMWFNMNDEFNASIKNGSTKTQAQKDARLRGINKFFRMTVQVIISGTLNNIFTKQYNNSITKAGLVVAASTILTDAASRLMTGMPTKKMTKEELEAYQKAHKEGFMSAYYKLIDTLAS